MAQATVTSEINGLYVTLYGVPATNAGLTYWINTLAAYDPTINLGNAGTTPISLPDQIYLGIQMTAGSPIVNGTTYFATLYPTSITDTQYVEDLYQNMANFQGTAAGVQYWFNLLQHLESLGDTVIQAREGIAGEFVHDFLSNNLTVGAAALGLSQTDWQLLVAGQQALLNKVAVSSDWSVTTAGNPGSILNYTSVNSPAFAAGMQLLKDVNSDPHSVVLADNAIAAANASDSLTPIIDLVIPPAGQTFDLTTGIDNLKIGTIGTVDHVEGVIDTTTGSTDSTYTVGDNVQGNGLTVVDIAVQGTKTGTAPLATLSGVSTVNFFKGMDHDLTVNAALWNNVNTVTDKGETGDITVQHLNVTNGKGLSLAITATGTGAYLTASKGHVSGLSYYAELESGKGVGTIASFGTQGVNATVAKSGYLNLSLYQSVDHVSAAQGAATVGNITIGNVNVVIGQSGSLDDLSIYNYAKAYDHNATVGNIAVGNVTVNAAAGGSGYAGVEIYNEAYVETGAGNAAAGNVTVGNIAMTHPGSDYAEIYVYNEAYNYGTAGNATVGNVTVGNVAMTAGSYGYMDISNDVYVEGAGNAVAGNVSVGNVSIVHGAHGYYITAYIDNYASADASGKVANATVGNVTVGNVSQTNALSHIDTYIKNGAQVYYTGNAAAGNLAVGNVTLTAVNAADNYVSIDNYASAGEFGKGGTATVGNVSVGNVTMSVASGSATVDVYNEAHNYGSKAHNATVGNVSIGTVSLNDVVGTTKLGGAILGGSNELYVKQSADAYHGNASVGSITVGNISINAAAVTLQSSAANSVDLYNRAYASHGTATVGNITVGNVTANTGVAGFEYVYVSDLAKGTATGDSTGLITVGNVAMNAGSGAFMEFSAYNEAKLGTAGGISIGNVSMHETKVNGTGSLDVHQSGAITDKVSVGNVAITAAKIGLYIENLATSGAAGGVSVGNVSLKGADYGAGANYIDQKASLGAAGTVTVGNVSLSDGKGQYLALDVSNDAANKVGAVTVGNVAIAVHNSNAATVNATAILHVESSSSGGKAGGNITTGNITIGSSGETTKATLANHMFGYVTLDSVDGNVTVGNITVTGGVVETGGAKAVLDNFSDLQGWLTITTAAGGTITVGNVDYSGYAGKGDTSTIIDVHTYKGAASIIGSTGGTDITDNSGTNAIDVSHTTKADIVNLQDSQSAVSDNGSTLTATQSALDSIIGIHSGDVINLVNHSTQAPDLTGTTITNGGAMSFATFLVNAETDLHGGGSDAAYTGNVGGNTYVALWNGTSVAEIVDVVGIHTFTESGGALHFAT